MEGDLLLLILVLWPMAGAVLSYLMGRRSKTLRDYFSDFVTATVLVALAALFAGFSSHGEWSFRWADVCGIGIHLQLDGFRILLGTIAALLWTMSSIFSKEYLAGYRNRNRYYFFYLMTFGSTLGLFFAADLFTAFIFFEIMSLASYVLVIHDEKPASMRAGATYLVVAVIGGMVMLMGLFLLQQAAGTLEIRALAEVCADVEDKSPLYLAGALILFGYGAKAGMFPLHIWLPKAHPVAPAPASALLSGILTKAGVFGVLSISANMFLHDARWGMAILLLGTTTMLLGAVLALFPVDLKRTLACSSMSQIGFILVGAGMQGLLGHHNALAVRGTILHMVNHSLLKLVLFTAAGVVYINMKSQNLNKIRGFGRGKPIFAFSFAMGYLGIIGMPFWNGYISKTLLHESIVEYIGMIAANVPQARFFQAVEWLFIFSGGLTAAYMTKLFVALFVDKRPGHQDEMDACNKRYMRPQSCFALLAPALILPVLGFFPGVTMDRLATMAQGFMHGENPAHAVHYFSWVNMQGTLLSLLTGAAVYILFIRVFLMKKDERGVRVYVDRWPAWLDIETLAYRPFLSVAIWLGAFAARIMDAVPNAVVGRAAWIVRPLNPKKHIQTKTPRVRYKPVLTGSLSFSLLLFGVGFCSALVYLIFAWLQ